MLRTRLADAFERHADRVAYDVPSLGARATFAELRAGAASWAAMLGGLERPLVVHVDKGPVYYALLAHLFLDGRSFCPVDRVNPAGRVRQICEQLDGSVLLTDDPSTAAALREHGIDVIDAATPTLEGIERTAAAHVSGRYYISTSGSTGTPKLVEVRHNAVLPIVDWAVPYFDIRPGDRWAQFSSIGFDLSIADAVFAWNAGAALVGIRTLAEVARLDRVVARAGITHWHSVPSVVPYLARDEASDLSSLRMLAFCGEPLLRAHCERVRARAPEARIVNTYGPTEGTLWCTYHEVTDADIADATLPSMPIGQAVPGWNLVYARGTDGARLVIAGEHLAEGYHGRPDPAFGTAVIGGHTFATFDTGDHFVFRNGRACFSHRTDQMVKVNGNRVDLGDVTDACARAGLDQPVVVFDGTQLVLFVESATPLDTSAVLDSLRSLLPAYAVPSRHHVVARFPRTASGKIDRRALLDLAATTDHGR
jgi:D-alanine--poly(phosphoribitol) ligase subunit 1